MAKTRCGRTQLSTALSPKTDTAGLITVHTMRPTPSPPRRVLQFTDCHLLTDPSSTFQGVNPLQTLDAVIQLAFAEHPSPDLILLTGDLSQDASTAAYQRIRQRFGALATPVGIIPGNHDCSDTMQATLDAPNMQLCGALDCGAWRIILLNSRARDRVGGAIHAEQLDQLQQQLSADDRPTLICLHHHPVPMGCTWLDTIGLDHPAAFLALLERHPSVRGVLWGHVHQAFDDHRGEIMLMATPSTSVQFKPGSDDFALDSTPPGYRWLDLHPDGRIVTGIQRLAEMPQGLDLSSAGY